MEGLEIRGGPLIRELYPAWRGVRVTEATLTVGHRVYRARDLTHVRQRSGRVQVARQVILGFVVVESTAVATALTIVLSAPGRSLTQLAISVTAALAQAAMSAILIAFAVLRWPTPIELVANYRGQPTVLYRSPDQYEVGKVLRAVERAILASWDIK